MTKAKPFNWDSVSVLKLQKLASEGLTASAIAREIGGGLTRSAVCGKAHRLKVRVGNDVPALERKSIKARLATPARITLLKSATPDQAKMRVDTYHATPTRQKAFAPEHAPAGARVVPLAELEPGECKWPLYEDGPFLFCGCPVRHDKGTGLPPPYCPVHLDMSKGGQD